MDSRFRCDAIGRSREAEDIFIRENRQRRSDGTEVVYLQVVESARVPGKTNPTARVVYNFGRLTDEAVAKRLRELARSILRRVSPEEMVGDRPGCRVVGSWPYGDLHVLEALWERIGMKKLLPAIAQDNTKAKLPVERAAFAMVANRCCAPSSKLYLFGQWLREEVRIAGAEALGLQHLYRSLDFFEAHKEAIEKELFFRVADLFSCDVDLVLYDTTNIHFEIDEEDAGGAADVKVMGSNLASHKQVEALRQRGHAKNHRDDAPLAVIDLAMTRHGLPIRSWVFRGDTVDVKTVAQVKADLNRDPVRTSQRRQGRGGYSLAEPWSAAAGPPPAAVVNTALAPATGTGPAATAHLDAEVRVFRRHIGTLLKGWRLTRCVFVGDAGMFSPANREALGGGGGKYGAHRGGAVSCWTLPGGPPQPAGQGGRER